MKKNLTEQVIFIIFCYLGKYYYSKKQKIHFIFHYLLDWNEYYFLILSKLWNLNGLFHLRAIYLKLINIYLHCNIFIIYIYWQQN